MPNFKPKANKKIKINSKAVVTVDTKHNEKMNEFFDISNTILPHLLKTQKKLIEKVSLFTMEKMYAWVTLKI